MKCICGEPRLHVPMIYFLLITVKPALELFYSMLFPFFLPVLTTSSSQVAGKIYVCVPSPHLHALPLMCCLCEQTAVCLPHPPVKVFSHPGQLELPSMKSSQGKCTCFFSYSVEG